MRVECLVSITVMRILNQTHSDMNKSQRLVSLTTECRLLKLAHVFRGNLPPHECFPVFLRTVSCKFRLHSTKWTKKKEENRIQADHIIWNKIWMWWWSPSSCLLYRDICITCNSGIDFRFGVHCDDIYISKHGGGDGHLVASPQLENHNAVFDKQSMLRGKYAPRYSIN